MSSSPTAVSVVEIDKSGDLIVRVSEDDNEVRGPDDRHRVFCQVVDFKVSREVLVTKSPFFKKLLRSPNFAEASKDLVSLKGDMSKA